MNGNFYAVLAILVGWLVVGTLLLFCYNENVEGYIMYFWDKESHTFVVVFILFKKSDSCGGIFAILFFIINVNNGGCCLV